VVLVTIKKYGEDDFDINEFIRNLPKQNIEDNELPEITAEDLHDYELKFLK
jgi:hypothetical protein